MGFGSVVAGQSRARLLNRDGSFNVEREGLNFFTSLSPYHALLTMGWRHFLGLIVLGYLAVNLVFAGAYFACGPGTLEGLGGSGAWSTRRGARSPSAARLGGRAPDRLDVGPDL